MKPSTPSDRFTINPVERVTYSMYPLFLVNAAGDNRIAEDEDAENDLALEGYKRPGKPNEKAFLRAGMPSLDDYKVIEYPKWVLGKLVNSREEEDALQPRPGFDLAAFAVEDTAPKSVAAKRTR